MALLAWDKTYSVGIQSIDDQHAGLFDSINELHHAMLKGQEKTVTGRLLLDLQAYTRGHFSAEEMMLAKARYPDLAAHRFKHQNLMAQVTEYSERHQRGEAALSLHLVNFLRDCLTQHILQEDRAYSAWLTQAGIRF